jgi:hypothetical protein
MSRYAESLRTAEPGLMQTSLFLVGAARPSGIGRMDAIIEATSESCAIELHKHHFGFYDAEPDYDLDDVTVQELPRLVGDLTVTPIDL